jgi:choice-of-anchor B domain-containing protein
MRLTHLAVLATFPLLATSALAQPAACEDGLAGEYPCQNVELLSHVSLDDFDSEAGSGHWGWTDPETGREYALMGLADGTGFVDITEPTAPVYLGKLPAHTVPSIWRELKVLGHYAVIVSEADGHGMQIFDLHGLRGVDRQQAPVTFKATAHYGNVGQSHNVAANDETQTAFIVGSRAATGCAGGIHMVDMANPLNPTFSGCFAEDGYTHDLLCLTYDGYDRRYAGREMCFASNENVVTIVDVTERDAPRMVSQVIYPNIGYTHQGWFTEDQRYFIVNDELDEMRYGHNTRTLVFDFADLEAPRYVGNHFGPTRAVAHNLYVRGDKVYMANYRRGLEVARIDDAGTAAMTHVAHFDSYPEDDATQFGGAWNVYPFYESGTVTIADQNRGLFMVRPYRDEPLAVTGLSARRNGAGALLAWRLDRDDLEHVVVEREDAGRFVAVARVRTEPERLDYELRADLAPGEHTLRLRALDRDGFAVYSIPQTLTLSAAMSAR